MDGRDVVARNGNRAFGARGRPAFTQVAADELAAYIEKASGAKPEVIEGEPETFSGLNFLKE